MDNKYAQKDNYYTGFKANEWSDIEYGFINYYGGNLKLVELTKHIRQSGLSKRIYGISSMGKLIIGNNELINFHIEALHVEYNLDTETWSFNYYAKPQQDPEFVRTYSADEGIEKFDQFIEWIRW